MNINMMKNFSLFSSNTSSNSPFGGINLADYASIKNGSYAKLAKVYYGKNTSSNPALDSVMGNKFSVKDKETTKELAKLESDSDSLKESADALLSKGSKSVFTKKEIEIKNEDGTTSTSYGYDTDAIYKDVKSFVDDYNAMVKSGGDASSDAVLRQTYNMTNTTKSYEKLLSNIGITVGKDNQLTLNEEKFKKADMEQVKSLFNTTGSYGYNISSKASQINYTAEKEASKANTYNAFGSYGDPFTSGNLYNSYF